MTRLVFIDVGSHVGQTLEEVTSLRWKFDKILGLEPMAREFQILFEKFGHRKGVELFNFGLGYSDGRVPVYGTNDDLGASIYQAKARSRGQSQVTTCEMRQASAFLRENVQDHDVVLMKLNCEGAEVPIIDNLIDTGEIWRMANVMIDFDIRKVPGLEHEAERIMKKLEAVGFSRFCLCEEVMIGPTHQIRIARWLESTGLVESRWWYPGSRLRGTLFSGKKAVKAIKSFVYS